MALDESMRVARISVTMDDGVQPLYRPDVYKPNIS